MDVLQSDLIPSTKISRIKSHKEWRPLDCGGANLSSFWRERLFKRLGSHPPTSRVIFLSSSSQKSMSQNFPSTIISSLSSQQTGSCHDSAAWVRWRCKKGSLWALLFLPLLWWTFNVQYTQSSAHTSCLFDVSYCKSSISIIKGNISGKDEHSRAHFLLNKKVWWWSVQDLPPRMKNFLRNHLTLIASGLIASGLYVQRREG